MVHYTIAPPPGSMQAIFAAEAEAKPTELSREEQISITLKKSIAAARRREARVKAALNVELSEATSSVLPPHVSSHPAVKVSSEGSILTAKASSRRALAYQHFAMSISGALNKLLSIASSSQSNGAYTSVAAAAADLIGPPLSQRCVAGSAVTADTANIFELYLIMDTAVCFAPLGWEGLLDAYMLIDRAVAAGYTLSPEDMRQTLVAALSIAHERAGAKQRRPKESAYDFAERCFPSLNLRNLAATEYMLSQKLKFDLRCLDRQADRQACVGELAMIATHYENVFVNYLQIIEKRQAELQAHGRDEVQGS
eukprot:6196656-Pleurochrysis_carterae.AAC.1